MFSGRCEMYFFMYILHDTSTDNKTRDLSLTIYLFTQVRK